MKTRWDTIWVIVMVGIATAVAGCDGSGSDGGDTEQADAENPAITMDNVVLYQGVSGAFGVEVTATDDVGVETVELLVDGVVAASSSAEPFTISWDTTSLADGTIVPIAARATDFAGKTAETAPVDVVVVNDGYVIEFTDGFSGEISIPDPYLGTEEIDKKHHWIATDGGASRILAIVLFTFEEGAEWQLALDIGTGYCPDSGVSMDAMAVTAGAEPIVFDSEPEGGYPGGGQMFFHLKPGYPDTHLGESIGYEVHAYSFN
jgi:hypothetical protein